MVEYPQFDDKFIMILVITGNKTLMQPITSVVGIGSSKHDFMGCGLNKFSDIRLAEYIKLLNRQYITNEILRIKRCFRKLLSFKIIDIL